MTMPEEREAGKRGRGGLSFLRFRASGKGRLGRLASTKGDSSRPPGGDDGDLFNRMRLIELTWDIGPLELGGMATSAGASHKTIPIGAFNLVRLSLRSDTAGWPQGGL